jgi:hypothetical protein
MKEKTAPEKSFLVALEQMASMLRKEVKLKERKTQVLSASSLSPSLSNFISQVAVILRKQVQRNTIVKKSQRRKQD